ncbi:MAG TPA: alpha/beta hydrolase-fold protein, partial [Isosphaeraceae bacterium]
MTMTRRRVLGLLPPMALLSGRPRTLDAMAPPDAAAPRLRFEVTLARHLAPGPRDGRLFVALAADAPVEPRLVAGRTGLDAPPILARDVAAWEPGAMQSLDARAAAFPIADLDHLPPGDYAVQAVLDVNDERTGLNSPGNLYSATRRVHLDPARGGAVALELDQAVPPEAPEDGEWVRFLAIRSERLSAFHGRPIRLRAGVILPRDFDREPTRRYPLRVHIGGFGARSTEVRDLMAEGHPFRRAWLADDAPRMILLHLDGAGPLGDPYQVNSANNGPYGDAVVGELIPEVERRFRGIARGSARVLDGGSTGGWVALALQIFYPESFQGAWAFCPDSVDFRSFQLIDLDRDRNAYVNAHGFERPAARELSGDVRYTMRHECQMENVLGRGDSWTLSGGQWGSWNAVYGPRGPDGRPAAAWDPATGAIDPAVVAHWARYDLRRVLQDGWATLGPKLRGKLHIWVGEADDYFLNNAVHRL